MKEYNREKRIWEEVSKNTSKGTLKKKETCRGGKPHDYQLVLPSYGVTKVLGREPTEVEVQKYYEYEDDLYHYEKALREKLTQETGLTVRYGNMFSRLNRHLQCSVCGKREYQDVKDIRAII